MKRMLPPILMMLFASSCLADNDADRSLPSDKSDLSIEKIINNYVIACGDTALNGIWSETGKGTLLRGATGRVPFQTYAKSPGKWRYDQVFAWGDQISHGYDGISDWMVDTGGIHGLDSQQLFDMKSLFDFQLPLHLNNIYSRLDIIGSEKINEKEAATVRAVTSDGVERELAFDKESGLLVRMGKIWFEDYRQIGAVKRPFRILLGTDEGDNQRLLKMEFADIRHNEEINDSLFYKPVCPLPMLAPAIYKHRSRAVVSNEAMDACVGIYQHPRDTSLTISVTRQQNHLMIAVTGKSVKTEIMPESDLDYYMEFVNQEYHFVKDESGAVVGLEFGADRRGRVKKLQ